MKRREPPTSPEPYPPRLAEFVESDWAAPKPGSPMAGLGHNRGYRRMQWTRARLAWERDHDPEYQRFVADGYRRNG